MISVGFFSVRLKKEKKPVHNSVNQWIERKCLCIQLNKECSVLGMDKYQTNIGTWNVKR